MPITTWPSEEQKDSGDILAAEMKAEKCHKKLEVCTCVDIKPDSKEVVSQRGNDPHQIDKM